MPIPGMQHNLPTPFHFQVLHWGVSIYLRPKYMDHGAQEEQNVKNACWYLKGSKQNCASIA